MPEIGRENIFKRIFGTLTVFAIAGFANPVRAQVPGLELTIELRGFPASESVEKNTYSFSQICELFGAHLTQNRGLLGTGPFDSVHCSQTSDKKSNAASKSNNIWILRIDGDNKTKKFEVFWRDNQGNEISQARYVLETEAGPLSILAKSTTRTMIAYYLTTSMPFRSVLTSAMIKNGKADIKGSIGTLRRIKVPPTLSIFTLSRVDDIWQTTPIAAAKMAEDTGKKVTWSAEDLPVPNATSYFVQQTEGRRETLHQVDMLIQSDVDNFADKFLTLGRAGYAGVRYGVPPAGEGVLKKAKMVGLYGEFRSGILAGLKLNYDFTPVQKHTDNLGATSYSWSRFQMGYGFSRALSNKVFNWVDMTPRIGFTTMELHYTPADDTTQAYEFKLTKAPTAGLEIGTESRTNYFITRLWAFGSLSVPIVPIDRNHNTNSIRAGIDFYREIFSLGNTKVAGMLFGAIDSTSVSKKLSASEIAASQAQTIRLTSFYIGGGTSLTW